MERSYNEEKRNIEKEIRKKKRKEKEMSLNRYANKKRSTEQKKRYK